MNTTITLERRKARPGQRAYILRHKHGRPYIKQSANFGLTNLNAWFVIKKSYEPSSGLEQWQMTAFRNKAHAQKWYDTITTSHPDDKWV